MPGVRGLLPRGVKPSSSSVVGYADTSLGLVLGLEAGFGPSSVGSWGCPIQSSQKASVDSSQRLSKPMMLYKRKNKEKR